MNEILVQLNKLNEKVRFIDYASVKSKEFEKWRPGSKFIGTFLTNQTVLISSSTSNAAKQHSEIFNWLVADNLEGIVFVFEESYSIRIVFLNQEDHAHYILRFES